MPAGAASRNSTVAYVAPFAVYVALLALEHVVARAPLVFQVARFLIVLAFLLRWSWPSLRLRPSCPLASVALGIAVFLVWIAPDLLFGYRHYWLFENSITGKAASSFSLSLRHDPAFVAIRALTAAALVPVIEELFWRGWLMRWLVDSRDFAKVPLGTYQAFSFWAVAVLFAIEHGPYWDVGLVAGVLYNWWVVHTRNLADCVVAHAVTNAALAFYVVIAGQWQYWL